LYSEPVSFFRDSQLVNDEKEFALFKDFEHIFTNSYEFSMYFPVRIEYEKIVEIMEILGIRDEIKD